MNETMRAEETSSGDHRRHVIRSEQHVNSTLPRAYRSCDLGVSPRWPRVHTAAGGCSKPLPVSGSTARATEPWRLCRTAAGRFAPLSMVRVKSGNLHCMSRPAQDSCRQLDFVAIRFLDQHSVTWIWMGDSRAR